MKALVLNAVGRGFNFEDVDIAPPMVVRWHHAAMLLIASRDDEAEGAKPEDVNLMKLWVESGEKLGFIVPIKET
jgi:hypothetical protein